MEFLLSLVEVVIGFFDMVTSPVKRIGKLVDRSGIPGLQLVVEFPRMTAGRPAQLTDVEVGQNRWCPRGGLLELVAS
nr:hypothetical protein [Mycobacterium kyorinense]